MSFELFSIDLEDTQVAQQSAVASAFATPGPSHCRPAFRVSYPRAQALLAEQRVPSPAFLTSDALSTSDARTRRWVNTHRSSSFSLDFADEQSESEDEEEEDSSAGSSCAERRPTIEDYHHGDDEFESSSSDDDEDSLLFMHRGKPQQPPQPRLVSKFSMSSIATSVDEPLARSAAPRPRPSRLTGLSPLTRASAAPVVISQSRARGASSLSSPPSSPIPAVAVAPAAAATALPMPPSSSSSAEEWFDLTNTPSLVTDDDEHSPSEVLSVPTTAAAWPLSRGRCRPSTKAAAPQPVFTVGAPRKHIDMDSDDERWWLPSPPNAAHQERERFTSGSSRFYNAWMNQAVQA